MLKAEKPQKSLFLSLIIPAFRQEKTIQKDLRQVLKVMDVTGIRYEIIVVVDGILDKTKEKAKQIKSSKLKVFTYPTNHGKGYAVRFGMAKSKGNIIAFIDAGMDLDPKGIKTLLEIMQTQNADIVIGSKLHPRSQVKYPWQRTILSWGYRSLVKAFFGLSIRDTQVGLKLFRRRVLEQVLPRLLVKRYAFDVEILAVAYRLGYKNIQEAPIKLTFNNWSSITSTNFWWTISKMLWDTGAVFYRLKIRHYYDDKSKRQWKYDPELNFRINVG